MKQKTKILAALAVASSLIFASCSNSDSAMPEKVKNSAIAQPGEGLKIAVYTFDPGALDQSVANDEWGRGLENQINRSDSAFTLCEGADTETGNIEFDGGLIYGCPQDDYVLVHYSGTITAPGEAGQSRSVAFNMAADDGTSLSIDGQSVIESWTVKPCSSATGETTLEAGKSVAIDAWYFEYRGGQCNGLYWSIDGGEMTVVPPSAFTPGDVKAPETSVAPEEETTTTVAVDTPIEITSPPEIVVDPTATDYSCTSECVKEIAAAAGLPDGVVSVSVDGGTPVALTGTNAVPLATDASSLVFTVASGGKTKDITVPVKRTAVEASDTTVAPGEESDTTVAAGTDSETDTSGDSSGSSPILWIIIALIVIAVIAYLVRRSQASKA
jgi:hypothetical protein